MKIQKTASGKTEIRISKSEWEAIGTKQGWMKTSSKCRECDCDCSWDECCSEAGVFKGCPKCGSKNVQK